MSQITKLAETAELLYSKVIKTYTLKDIVKHRYIPYKNLYEICSQYPTQGVGFKVFRKTWPQNKYYIVKDTQFKDMRHGKIYGILYNNNIPQNDIPIKIRNGSKRGVWRYDINDQQITTDNGIYYSSLIMNDYKPNSVHQEQ